MVPNMKFLRALNEESKVELTKKPSRDEISAAWPHGVTYKGQSIFKLVYDNDGVMGRLTQILNQANEDLSSFDSQESYLGYVPSKDMFVMGWDTWGEEDYDTRYREGEDEDEYAYDEGPMEANETTNVLSFKLQDGKLQAVDPVHGRARMMYGRTGMINILRRDYPDLIDIRLD